MDQLNYAWQLFIYGVLRQDSPVNIDEVTKDLKFISHYDADTDMHWLECPDLPEFYVTGKDKQELAQNVTDTLLSYYDIPTYFARRYKPENVRFSFENQKTGEHEYVSLDYIEELKQAAA